jgi:hypothetical protein
MPPTRREIFLDHGRVQIECPRLMSDAELAEVLKAFIAEIEARPPKPSRHVERPSNLPAFRSRNRANNPWQLSD